MLKQLITLQLNLIHELEVYWKSFLKEINHNVIKIFYEAKQSITQNITT